jgi:hypothetical protein
MCAHIPKSEPAFRRAAHASIAAATNNQTVLAEWLGRHRTTSRRWQVTYVAGRTWNRPGNKCVCERRLPDMRVPIGGSHAQREIVEDTFAVDQLVARGGTRNLYCAEYAVAIRTINV